MFDPRTTDDPWPETSWVVVELLDPATGLQLPVYYTQSEALENAGVRGMVSLVGRYMVYGLDDDLMMCFLRETCDVPVAEATELIRRCRTWCDHHL